MKSADLSVEQLRRLKRSLGPKLAYVARLRQRMQATRFPEHDRMLRDVTIAEAGLRSLLGEIETYLGYKDVFR